MTVRILVIAVFVALAACTHNDGRRDPCSATVDDFQAAWGTNARWLDLNKDGVVNSADFAAWHELCRRK